MLEKIDLESSRNVSVYSMRTINVIWQQLFINSTTLLLFQIYYTISLSSDLYASSPGDGSTLSHCFGNPKRDNGFLHLDLTKRIMHEQNPLSRILPSSLIDGFE